jgi:hypothetical protein
LQTLQEEDTSQEDIDYNETEWTEELSVENVQDTTVIYYDFLIILFVIVDHLQDVLMLGNTLRSVSDMV